MSKELERLEELVKHDETYFMDNMAMMGALALILKRQECQHYFDWQYEEGGTIDVTSIGSDVKETIQSRIRLLNKVCKNCGLVRAK